MKEVNKELIEEIEPQIQKTVGGPCEDFEFSDISNYHELLKYVGLGVHEVVLLKMAIMKKKSIMLLIFSRTAIFWTESKSIGMTRTAMRYGINRIRKYTLAGKTGKCMKRLTMNVRENLAWFSTTWNVA